MNIGMDSKSVGMAKYPFTAAVYIDGDASCQEAASLIIKRLHDQGYAGCINSPATDAGKQELVSVDQSINFCKVIIFLLTENFLQSQPCNFILYTALSHRQNGSIIIPLILGKNPRKLPPSLKTYNCQKFRNTEQFWKKLAASVTCTCRENQNCVPIT